MSNLRKDNLIWEGYTLLQDEEGFRFSFDAVILACFFTPKPKGRVLDAACGNGVLPLLLLAKDSSLKITGIELDEETAALARKNMAENCVSVEILQGDAMKSRDYFLKESFDAIIANPPYYPKGKVRLAKNPKVAMAKTELFWDSTQFFENCFFLLKSHGTLTLSYPIERKKEIEALGMALGFSIKRRLLLGSLPHKSPYLILFEFEKNGENTETIDDELTIYQEQDIYSQTTLKILKEKSCAI